MDLQTWFRRHSTGKLMRKKMRYLPGFVDLICIKIFKIGNFGVDIKHKNGHKWCPRGSPWARIWHVPYYHIPKHLFIPKGGQLELNIEVFNVFGGSYKCTNIIYRCIYSPIFTMVKPYSYHGEDTAAADPSRRKEHLGWELQTQIATHSLFLWPSIQWIRRSWLAGLLRGYHHGEYRAITMVYIGLYIYIAIYNILATLWPPENLQKHLI